MKRGTIDTGSRRPSPVTRRSWIRLDVACMRRGFTSKLSAGEFAAWVKFLLEVKDAGNGGILARADLDRDWCRKHHISPTCLESMLEKAIALLTVTNRYGQEDVEDHLEVVNWATYQPDPTTAERQREWRRNHTKTQALTPSVTDRNGVSPLRNGCNADVTGRDVTAKDNDVCSTASKKPDAVKPAPVTFDPEARRFLNVTDADKATWKGAFPGIDLVVETRKAIAWLMADWPARRKSKWKAFLTRWFSKAQDDRGGRAGPAPPRRDPWKEAEESLDAWAEGKPCAPKPS